ncbi:MAG TPA: YkgJ family cysteine cluster protein [Candidatus Thermoplasmatota archaeon]|nr:YkgJ family cysteine cluster protein [Candidatus Thermoplasmatota archaeon]
MAAVVDYRELAGATFACLEGCGLCCATAPRLVEDEPRKLAGHAAYGRHVRRRSDGTVALALSGSACAMLDGARACSAYEARPTACRLFPFHVHLGPRIQVSLHRGCPGVAPGAAGASSATDLAKRVVAQALTPAALAEADRAALNFREFARRAAVVGWEASLADLAPAFAPVLPDLLDPGRLAEMYARLASGEAGLEEATAALDEPGDPAAFLADLALETFQEDPEGRPTHVADGFAWRAAVAADDRVTLFDVPARGEPRIVAETRLGNLPVGALDDGAREALARYLAIALARDHAAGAAARLVDRMGYEVTVPAAYARVAADTAGGLLLRAALEAKAAGRAVATAREADLAIRAQDMAFLSLPTIGAVL